MASLADNLKNKLMSKLQNTKLLKELREYDSLVKAIGECKSKMEEDRIITAETETLKQRFSDPRLDKTRGREYMVRLIYCEMLGHDVSWAYVKALQFVSEPNILTKKAAYLALTQFFDHKHELVLLLVNTLLSDLKSDNFINVSTALVVCTKLIGADLINAVYPLVLERLKHPKEHVRKKAVMALHRFYQLDPKRDGPLAGVDLDRHFRTMLCDKDPGVMSTALCALHDVIKAEPGSYKNLIPSFISILKQVSEHRLPKSYDYHRFPAPFIQIKLLKILAILGAGDRGASENMYAVVQQALKRASNSHAIGNALIFECVTTITTIFPNPHLLAQAAEAVATFLRSPSHNLRYVGIDALAGIVKINPQAAQEHQLAVVDCLEDPDDTLKLKTLELLYKMTKSGNVEVIVERMVAYLRTATDEHIKKDIARKVSELAERYAPSPAWFIRVVSEVLELGGDHVEPGLVHSLTKLIAEQDQELHRSAVTQYMRLLDVPLGRKLPDALIQVMMWVLGEYGSLLANGQQDGTIQQMQSKLVAMIQRQQVSDTTRLMLMPALAKLSAQAGTSLSPEAAAWVNKAMASQSAELQQRAYELQALLTAPQQVQSSVLPHDASCEEIDDAEMQDIAQLGFLSWYVEKALQSGAAPHQPHHVRAAKQQDKAAGAGLRFEAYERAQPITSAAAAAAAGASSGFDDFFGSGTTSTSHTARVATSSTPAQAPSNQPQLLAASKAGAGRWGPAQFEGLGSTSAHDKAGSAHTAGSADLLGGVATSHTTSTSSSSKPAVVVSDRDRLAASLFAGLSGPSSGSARAAASKPSATPAAQVSQAAAPAMDLLSLDDDFSAPSTSATTNPAATATAAAPASSAMDLLMDLTSSIGTSVPSISTATANANAVSANLIGSPLASAGFSSLAAAPAAPSASSLLGGLGALGTSTTNPATSGAGGLGMNLGNLLGDTFPAMPSGNASNPAGTGLAAGMHLFGSPSQPTAAGVGGGLGLVMPASPLAGLGINMNSSKPGPGMGMGMAMNMPTGSPGVGLAQKGVTATGAFSGLAQAAMSSMSSAAPSGQGMMMMGGLGMGTGTNPGQQPATQPAKASTPPADDPFADLI